MPILAAAFITRRFSTHSSSPILDVSARDRPWTLPFALSPVKPRRYSRFGAVSRETAEAMAIGARRRTNATYALSITGAAGPDSGGEDVPVGTMFVGLADAGGTVAVHRQFLGDRQRIRIFTLNHLEYFMAHPQAMKVLSHEDDVLTGDYGKEIAAIKREYYRICVGLLDALKAERKLEFETRVAVLSLFGMMNWFYTWHNPRVDANAKELARQMSDIFLHGVCGTKSTSSAHKK